MKLKLNSKRGFVLFVKAAAGPDLFLQVFYKQKKQEN